MHKELFENDDVETTEDAEVDFSNQATINAREKHSATEVVVYASTKDSCCGHGPLPYKNNVDTYIHKGCQNVLHSLILSVLKLCNHQEKGEEDRPLKQKRGRKEILKTPLLLRSSSELLVLVSALIVHHFSRAP